MDLEDVLNGREPEPAAVAEAEEGASAEPSAENAGATDQPGQPRDPATGRYAPKPGEQEPPVGAVGQQPAAASAAQPQAPQPQTPETPTPERQPIPEAALIEERRKRQDAETRLAALEQQLFARQPGVHGQHVQQMQPHQAQQPLAQPGQPEAPGLIPSIEEDENGFALGILQHAEHRARQTLVPQLQREIVSMRREIQEDMVRASLPDYDEKLTQFAALARSNPAIAHACAADRNPAMFAYNYAKNASQAQQFGTSDLEAIKAQLREQILAEQAGGAPPPATPGQVQQPAQQAAPQNLPTSLADAPAGGAVAPAGGSAPPTLNDILSRK